MKQRVEILCFRAIRFSVACLFGGLSIPSLAQETIYKDGITYHVLDGNKLEVTQKYDFNEIMAFQNYGEESIIIPDTVVYEDNTYIVTSIGKLAFEFCSNLNSVSLPNSLTTIRDAAFIQTKLKRIVIPENVSSIEQSAFSGCTQLEEVVLPSKITSIPYNCFMGSKIKTIDIPRNVSEIGPTAFGACHSLETIILPDGLTTIGNGAFGECNSLVEIRLPETVRKIGGDVDDYYYTGAFEDCINLSYIRIPEGVESIGIATFSNCSSLVLAVIPSTVTQIGKNAFAHCDKLKSIYCFNPNPIEVGTDVFCSAYYGEEVPALEDLPIVDLCTLYVPTGSKTAYEKHDVWGVFNIEEFDPESLDLDELERLHGSVLTKINNLPDQSLCIPEIYYGINAQKMFGLQDGINIIRFSNGETRKIYKIK